MKKLIIINGITSGLGYEILYQLVNLQDVRVISLVRNISSCRDLIDQLNENSIYEMDLSNFIDTIAFEKYLKNVIDTEFKEYYFINNVSTIDPIGKIGSLSDTQISKSISVNITSNILLINSILKVFKEKKNIHILNISSGIAINPLPGASLYGIGKSYLDYLTQVLNIESIGNLKATSFYPGSMNTVMRSSFIDKLNSDSELSHFDYSHLSDQVLSSPAKIAAIIIENFICTKKGWAKQVSKFYDYE